MTARRFVLLVAGGTGTRMETDIPKQLILLRNRPVMFHTLDNFLSLSPDLAAVLVLHSSILDQWDNLADQWLSAEERNRVFVCPGGAERTSSVSNGLEKIAEISEAGDSLIAIHDAVRPFAFPEILSAAYEMAQDKGSAVACVKVKSSLREMTDSGSKAVDRSRFFHVQTPQIFRLGDLRKAYQERPHDKFTDDASLMEAAGHSVSLCEGSYDNIKITTPEDLAVAEIILSRQG